jgi:FMNH2-dependent dimethyl sulfone monooxygenase
MSTIGDGSREPPRRLGNRNRLQLGTFGTNLEAASTLTIVPGRLRAEWPQIRAVAQQADAMGLEAIVPVARWRGYGGPHNSHGRGFDTFAWAAALGAVTRHAYVFSTCHMPTMHPIVAAKQLATIDHVTGGRAGVNTVGGWFREELEMFGAPMLEHDRRYELAEEWTEILVGLWTRDDEFDFAGEFFSVSHAYSQPKPLQRPHPPIMNAGASARGRDYAARFADMAFLRIDLEDPAGSGSQIAEIRSLAAGYGREIEIWTNAVVVCRDSQEEAQAYLDWYASEHGDWEGAANALSVMRVESAGFNNDEWLAAQRSFIAGSGGIPMVGTAAQIVERMSRLAALGVDGCLLTVAEWEPELERFAHEVLPLIEASGLREPHIPPRDELSVAPSALAPASSTSDS